MKTDRGWPTLAVLLMKAQTSENCSGQYINAEKKSITFSPNTDEVIWRQIKSGSFCLIIKLHSRTEGEALCQKQEKQVLIKAVGQAKFLRGTACSFWWSQHPAGNRTTEGSAVYGGLRITASLWIWNWKWRRVRIADIRLFLMSKTWSRWRQIIYQLQVSYRMLEEARRGGDSSCCSSRGCG